MSGILKLAKALGVKLAPQEEALRVAQENAVKMLGLPPGNTPMDRARAMGFEDGYHGTAQPYAANRPVYGRVTSSDDASNTFSISRSPSVASGYAQNSDDVVKFSGNAKMLDVFKNDPEKAKVLRELLAKEQVSSAYDARLLMERLAVSGAKNANEEKIRSIVGVGDTRQNVMPLMVRASDFPVHDFGGAPWNESVVRKLHATNPNAAGILYKNVDDTLPSMKPEVSDTFSVKDMSRVRSRFAAFDPARINENNLLASRLLPFALPGLLALPQDE